MKSEIVCQVIDRVLNGGDIQAAEEYFWDDVVEEVPFPGQGPGLEGLKDVFRGLRTAFPDMNWTVEEQIEDSNKVVTRFVWTGTHQGNFLGIPPTSKNVSVWGMVIDKFEGNKIKSTRIIMDALGLMIQLGMIPTPTQSNA